MDFIDSVILKRASVRQYTGAPISRETLIRIAQAGTAAPSAVNIQPWEILIITRKNTLDALCTALPYAKMLDKASAAFVVCGNPEKDEHIARNFWVQDCSALTQNILLAVQALGLGAVWTAVYPDQPRVEAVRAILGIPPQFIPLNVIPVGVPTASVPPKNKFNKDALRWEGW